MIGHSIVLVPLIPVIERVSRHKSANGRALNLGEQVVCAPADGFLSNGCRVLY